MTLSFIDRSLWAAGITAQVALLLILIVKGRWRTFPVITLWVGFSSLRDTLLIYIYRYTGPDVYKTVYWSAAIVDLVLQVVLVFEIARVVLKPTGTWVRDARRLFLVIGTIGAFIAFVLAYAVSPGLAHSLAGWVIKGGLFASLLICELFVSMMLASTQLGLIWKNHVMGLAQGLTIWGIVALLIEAAHSYFGPKWHADTLDHIRIITYLGANLYWIVIFWSPEPESRKLSPEMQKYIFTLHQQVNFGLSSVSSSKQQS